MLYIGLSKTVWGRATPLPLHMGFMNAPGCFIRVSLDVPVPLPVIRGRSVLTANLPNTRSLVGIAVHTQFLVQAPGANAADLVATNGITTVIGGQR